MTKKLESMYKYENNISKYATKDSSYERIKPEIEDIRSPFFRDIDRIIYSFSYTKYLDKTQVFSFCNNDYISKRMTHVQLVSKIARTIGRALNLNEDLIEAIALGHDLGHPPLGHVGEKFLNKISLESKIGKFNHNAQSVRTLMYIDNNGEGRNLCIQTLDGILCHNGEFINNEYYPRPKSKEDFLKDYNSTYDENYDTKELIPMTLEGCVVRISDLIGYLGRDIEDAIHMGIINQEDLPKNLVEILGKNNSEIVNTIILDIIENSLNKPYIKLSEKIYNAVISLKDFNYMNIYSKAYTDEQYSHFEEMFNKLFHYYVNCLKNHETGSSIYKRLNKYKNEEYKKEKIERIVIDYIAGMTDEYFLSEYNSL